MSRKIFDENLASSLSGFGGYEEKDENLIEENLIEKD
jgi:hypothetical protein